MLPLVASECLLPIIEKRHELELIKTLNLSEGTENDYFCCVRVLYLLALHVVVAPLCTGGGAYILQDRGPPAARLILVHRMGATSLVSFLGFGNTDDSLFRCLVSHLRDTRGKTEKPNLNLSANLPAKINKKKFSFASHKRRCAQQVVDHNPNPK